MNDTAIKPVSPEELRAFREAAGLTQDELAERLGYGSPGRQRTVMKWESGKGQPGCLRPALMYVADQLAADNSRTRPDTPGADPLMDEAARKVATAVKAEYEHASVHWTWIRAMLTRAASMIDG